MPIRRINPERPQTSAERVRRWREKHQQPKEPDWGRLKAWLERGNKVPEDIPLWGPYTKYVRKLEQQLEEMTKSKFAERP